jgi:hypothetical protein
MFYAMKQKNMPTYYTEKSINIRQLHYPSLIHGFASMSRLRKAKLAVDNFLDDYKKIL